MIDNKAYILQNHKFLTVAQMADELGLSDGRLRDLCEELGIVAITPKQQAIDYVLEHHEKKSAKEMAATLGMGESTVLNYFRELGLNKPKGRPKGSLNKKQKEKSILNTEKEFVAPPFVKKEGMISVADILSGYQHPGSSHWMNDSADPYHKGRYQKITLED